MSAIDKIIGRPGAERQAFMRGFARGTEQVAWVAWIAACVLCLIWWLER